MREAQENVAHFRDLSVPDFERICEFSYRGTYTLPRPELFSDEDLDAATQMFHLADSISPYFAPYTERHDSGGDREGNGSEDKDEERASPSSETSIFEDPSSPLSSYRNFSNPNYGARLEWPVVSSGNRSWRENFAPVFLAHARLYAFAAQYMVPALKNKALQNVRDTLSRYTLIVSGLEAVIQLARFAYDSGYIANRDGGVDDPLRQLVVAYVVVHHTQS
jgi:hypothetical protein